MNAILTDPNHSWLLQVLGSVLPGLEQKLRIADAWRGVIVVDPSDRSRMYERVVCQEELRIRSSRPRLLLPALHAFELHDGAMHNHRFPFAVLPLSPAHQVGEVLYEMPWELRDGESCERRKSMIVRSVSPYAIENCLCVWHAVRSVRSHFSVQIADITDPPARENRLVTEPLSAAATEAIRHAVLEALLVSGLSRKYVSGT